MNFTFDGNISREVLENYLSRSVTAAKPIIWLMILLAIPGFFLWGIAYPLYKNVKKWRAEKVKPLIEAKLDEAEKVCEKGHALL